MSQKLIFSPEKYVYILLSIILTVSGLYFASSFFVPVAFSVLISFILLPMVRKLENAGINGILSIVLVFVFVIGLFLWTSFFFGSQIAGLISDFQSFSGEFESLLHIGINKFNETFYFLPPIDEARIEEKIKELASNEGRFLLGTTFIQTSTFLATAFLVPVYVFLFLLYRRGLRMGILLFFNKNKRKEISHILYELEDVGKNYLMGLFSVMIIMAILLSISLLLIGVDYAVMFGCLTGLLIVIPYIGTYIGGALTILYTMITMDGQSVFLVFMAFVLVHALEANFLTPKIVGSNTSVNPLAAFVALIVGGVIWGVGGMVLSIPFTAMLKKIFSHVGGLQPVAAMIGEDIYEKNVVSEEEIEIYFDEINSKESVRKKNIFLRLIKILFHKKEDKTEEE